MKKHLATILLTLLSIAMTALIIFVAGILVKIVFKLFMIGFNLL